jgi:1-acyl-sn-glycerol-3-phosphate acyltransferase
MNFCLVKNLLFLGVRVTVDVPFDLPKNTTLIFVSNHQSLFDISPVSWYFRKHHPKFVSKKELGTGIPSVSYNLRKGGAVLIDRSNGKQAISELAKFAKKINKNKWSAAIFPEGTRSKDGHPKGFATSGLKILTKYNPEGFIVPLTVNNSWKVFKYGKFPFGIGSPITITTHNPIAINSLPFEELITLVEEKIINDIK